MKKSIIATILSLSVVVFVVTSCDLIDKADDITFTTDFDLPAPFVVAEEALDPEPLYTSTNSSIEASQDPEFEKYKDRIKEIKVNSVTYTISDFDADGPVTLISGKAIFSADGSSNEVVAEVTNIALTEGATGFLTVSNEGLATIANIIQSDGVVVVKTQASISDAPVYFKVNVSLNVSITANALE